MIHVIATIEVTAGRRNDLLAECRKIVPLVRQEAGCLEYGPAKKREKAMRWIRLVGIGLLLVVAAAPVADESTGSEAAGETVPEAEPARQAPVAASTLNRTKYVAPRYPRSAERRNISGWVDVVFTVTVDGSVTDVEVVGSDPGDTFVDSATKAVEKWEFEPVVEDGRVEVRTAAVEMGQGCDTVFPLMAAEASGLGVEDVVLAAPDTSRVPDSGPSVASRTSMVVGSEVAYVVSLGVETVTVPELMVVERYSHVLHLVSQVEGRLATGLSAIDVLKACFPAGTVSGAPKIRAMEIIEELEPERRGPYAGAVGYFGFSGNMDFCITIRTFVMRDGDLWIQAGAGIVADSDPEKEFEETLNKARGLRRAVELAEKGL